MIQKKPQTQSPFLIRSEKLVSEFRKANLSNYPKVHEYKAVADRAMWVLWVLGEKFPNNDWVPLDIISDILVEVLSISSNVKSLKIAFNPIIGTLIHEKDFGGEILYKIMEKGKEHLRDISGEGKTPVYRIRGMTP